MKKLFLLTAMVALPLSLMAQDDMYFVPTKANKAKESQSYGMPKDTYYSGSSRSVDEYNGYTAKDEAGNDIIDFSATKGVYPEESAAPVEDYQYTRQLSRFDDYTPAEAYWDGYRDGSWSSPWYYNSWYSWYDRSWYWDTPWYYGGWATTTRGMHHAMSEVSEPSTEAIRASMLIAEVRQRVYVPLAIVNRQASPAARSATAAVCAPMAAPHVVATSTALRPRLHAAPVASEVYVPQAASEAAAAAQAPLVVAVAVVREAPSGVAAQVAEAVSADNDWKHNGLT